MPRITDQVAHQMDKFAHDDELYDVVVMPMPVGGQIQPVLMITLVIPSMVVGQQVTGAAMLPNLSPGEDVIMKAVHDLREQLMTARAEEAKQNMRLITP